MLNFKNDFKVRFMTSTSISSSSSSAPPINTSSSVEDSTCAFSDSTPAFWIGVTHLKSSKTAYLAADEWTLAGRVADFVIRQTETILPVFKESCEKAAGSIEAPSEDDMVSYASTLTKFQNALSGRAEKVKRISVNFYIPLAGPLPLGQVKMPYKLWTIAMTRTAELLKKIFPNLSHTQSSFNVHMGLSSYSNDSILSPDVDSSMISLRER